MSHDDLPEAERIELGPNDILQESAQDWVPYVVPSAVAAAGIASNHILGRQRNQTDRDRLDFEQRQYDDLQQANDPWQADDAT